MSSRSQRAANVEYYRRNRDLELARVRERQLGTVELLRDLRDRPCMDCGDSFAPHQMDFDHRDPGLKCFRLTSGAAMLRSRAALLEEAAKCDVVCANCHRVRTRRQQIGQRSPSSNASPTLARKRQAWRAQARLLDALRDRPCMDCGRWFPPCAMDFDHRNPVTKRYTVTRMVGRAGTARLLEEAAKCDIVCANCHRLRTFRGRSERTARE